MKRYVTWDEVETFIGDTIVIMKDKKLTGVFGFPRGGLVFAVMLSNRLNIPMLYSPVEGCLIVDDICDSGESLLHYYKNSSGEKLNYQIVTMFYKQNKLGVQPDYWFMKKGDDWIVFPWE